jgi:hypothetical protein
LAAVTTTSSTRGASVGMVTTPVPASMLAPAPVTAKPRFSPVKAWAVSTDRAPLPTAALRAARPPAATGAA